MVVSVRPAPGGDVVPAEAAEYAAQLKEQRNEIRFVFFFVRPDDTGNARP